MHTQSSAVALVLFTLSAVAACSSVGGSSKQLDITGTWRLCDVAAETGGSDYPGGGTYLQPGGILLDVTQQGGVVSASQIGADGGAVEHTTGWSDDAGLFCEGGSCGQTSVLLSGPFDAASRVWSAAYLSPHFGDAGTDIETYPARLTFSADGDHFTGIMDDGFSGANWTGGREDGTFTCASGVDASSEGGSGGSCLGLPICWSLPPCGEGCVLIEASDPTFSSCSPNSGYCGTWSEKRRLVKGRTVVTGFSSVARIRSQPDSDDAFPLRTTTASYLPRRPSWNRPRSRAGQDQHPSSQVQRLVKRAHLRCRRSR